MDICSAAAAKAGSLNTNQLCRLLDKLADHERTGDALSWSQSRHVRSPTSSPSPEGNNQFEACCYHELVKASGRPVVPIERLFHTSKDVEAEKKNFEQWLGDIDSGSRDGDVPLVFSTQLEDWESFQHKWQWDNRGKFAGNEGFSAFLESRRNKYLHKGELKVVSDPSFKVMIKQTWKYEKRFLEVSSQNGFTAYTHAVEKRLASHKFMQTFQLAEDPRQQDAWTTWVEYLNYVYWWRDRQAAAMKAAEPQYREACNNLQRFDAALSSTTSTTTRTLDEDLSATRAALEVTRQQIREFIRGIKAYQRAETAVRYQELRAQWVLEQLPLIETTPSLEHEVPKNDSNANSSKKRKLGDNHNILACQQPKRRRQTPVMRNKKAVTSNTENSEPRRSQRRRTGNAPGEAMLVKPQESMPATR